MSGRGKLPGNPEVLGACHQDGTVEKLGALIRGGTLFGVCLHSPGQDMITYMIAGEAEPASAPEEYTTRTIPAATWAVFPAIGPLPGSVQTLFVRIFQEWFPATGYEHTGAPELEVYPPGDAYTDDYRCGVWIPIVRK